MRYSRPSVPGGRATHNAHNALLDLEELEDREIDAFRARYILLAQLARERGELLDDLSGKDDTGRG